jgi:trehalose/maltose hydrolase-like predicted phosphorylase
MRKISLSAILFFVVFSVNLFAADSIPPIPVVTCTDFTKQFDPAYLSNGVIGVRPGPNPLADARCIVSGYVTDNATGWCVQNKDFFENAAQAPYPFETDIVAGGKSLLTDANNVKIISQSLDMSNGELTTKMKWQLGPEVAYDIEVLQFTPINLPCIACQKITVSCNADSGFELHRKIKIGNHQLKRNKLGVALTSEPNEGFSVKPGSPATAITIAALVPEIYHPEPRLQARRNAGWAKMLGFESIRQTNHDAWKELWKGRIKIYGDNETQKAIDAAFFYVHSSVNSATLTGVPPYGWSHGADGAYFGHIFWDMDTWVYHSVLPTYPAAAKAMMEYRYRNLEAAKNKARLLGYKGAMFSWEASQLDGHEVTPSTADTGWAEHHVVPEIAIAMWEYYLATGDDEFLKEKGWPVIREVANWVESRGVFTKRGFEILHVMGMDESVADTNNNAQVNILCKMAINAAIKTADKVGVKANPVWQKIYDQMAIPVDANGAIIPYDNCVVKDKAKGFSIGNLMALLAHEPPISFEAYKKSWQLEEKVASEMQPTPACPCSNRAVGFICPPRAACAAFFGDREKAAEFAKIAFGKYILSPYMTAKEYQGHTDGNFLTNQGAQLQSVIYGFTGLRLDEGNWNKYPATLPAGWEKIEIDRIWIKGKPFKMTAEHGAKATLTEIKN